MKSDSHYVSVVIPSIGRETLQSCLNALERQTRRSDEVFVIHDTEKRGGAYGRNKGIAQSVGNLIAITDDDCIPPDNWLENLIVILDEYDADVVGGTMIESDPFLDPIRKRRPFPTSVQVDSSGIVGNTANIIYKRSVLEKCLNRDGHIFTITGDNIELIWRLQQLGAKVIYSPIPILHMRKVTVLSYLQRQFTRGITIATLYKANRNAKQRFVRSPVCYGAMVKQALQALSCGLAIITSRVGGMPELVQQGRNGYMQDLNDIEGFQESLRVLLTDTNMLRNIRLASLQIAKRFDIELIVKK